MILIIVLTPWNLKGKTSLFVWYISQKNATESALKRNRRIITLIKRHMNANKTIGEKKVCESVCVTLFLSATRFHCGNIINILE